MVSVCVCEFSAPHILLSPLGSPFVNQKCPIDSVIRRLTGAVRWFCAPMLPTAWNISTWRAQRVLSTPLNNAVDFSFSFRSPIRFRVVSVAEVERKLLIKLYVSASDIYSIHLFHSLPIRVRIQMKIIRHPTDEDGDDGTICVSASLSARTE